MTGIDWAAGPWNTRADTDAWVTDPDSDAIIADFTADLLRANPDGIGSGGIGTTSAPPQYWDDGITAPRPINIACKIANPDGTPRNVLDLSPGRRDAYGWKRELALAWALNPCPIPAGAMPSSGGDHWLIVRRGQEMWECEQFSWHAQGRAWATWGAYWPDVRKATGFGAKNVREDGTQICWPNWGVTATSASLRAGVIDRQDLLRRNIDHTLALVVGNARAGVQARPAQRMDGGLQRPHAIVEGSWLRLDPTVDLAAFTLNPTALTIASALQEWGMRPIDKTAHGATLRGLYLPGDAAGGNPYGAWFPAGQHVLADLIPLYPHLQVYAMALAPADQWDQTPVIV